MRGWITVLVMLSVALGTSGSVFGAVAVFDQFAAGNQWSDAANWTPAVLPNGVDSDVRIEKQGVVITNGVAATAWLVRVSMFNRPASLTVQTGGSLYSKEGIYVGTNNRHGLLDVSGVLTVNPSRSILMGSEATADSSGTINFRSGSSLTTSGNIEIGEDATAGTFTVNQLGGTFNVGQILIGDTDGSAISGLYSISGGSLSAARLNTGGNGTSTAKFSVVGSDADISFSGTSWLAGNTELEFILDGAGISELDMTAGGYTVASTASLTVDASAYSGSIGDGILLIGTSEISSAFNAANVSLTSGYELDYRTDGVYVIPEPATMGLFGLAGLVLFIRRRFLI